MILLNFISEIRNIRSILGAFLWSAILCIILFSMIHNNYSEKRGRKDKKK